MDIHFNINRFFLVLKRDVFTNLRSVLFGILTVLSIFSFILVMFSFDDIDNLSINNINSKAYFIAFWVTGIFISGMAFKDLRNKEQAMSYLMLPASSLEKFLSILLLTTVGFFVSFTILFGVFNLINIAIIQSISDTLSLSFYNPINPDVWMSISVFIPIQAVFLTGATIFKRVPVFHTTLSLFVIGLVYGVIIFAILSLFFSELFFSGTGGYGSVIVRDSSNIRLEFKSDNVIPLYVLEIFFTYLMAPIFWLVTWFKLKEKEV